MKRYMIFFWLCMQLSAYAMEEVPLTEQTQTTPPSTARMKYEHPGYDFFIVSNHEDEEGKPKILWHVQCPHLTRAECIVGGVCVTSCCCIYCGATTLIPIVVAGLSEAAKAGLVICAACCATNGLGLGCSSCCACGVLNLRNLKKATGISAALSYVKSCFDLYCCCRKDEERKRLLDNHSQ